MSLENTFVTNSQQVFTIISNISFTQLCIWYIFCYRSIENHHTISSSTNDWTSIQGPFRKPPRLLHHHHHQNNGYHLQRSESSSTDPSVYHPNFNSFDSTFDEELQPERESSSSSTFNQFHENFRENDFHEKSSDGGGDQTPTNPNSIGINRSRSPLLNRTPSSTSNAQLDELLSEIYSRFGNGFRPFVDSSQRASASGSQVLKLQDFLNFLSNPFFKILFQFSIVENVIYLHILTLITTYLPKRQLGFFVTRYTQYLLSSISICPNCKYVTVCYVIRCI